MANTIFTSDLVVQDKWNRSVRIESINISLTYKDFYEGNAESMTRIIREKLLHKGKFHDPHNGLNYFYHDPLDSNQLPKYQITAHLIHDRPIGIDDPDAYSEVHLVFYREIVDLPVVEMVSEVMSEMVWEVMAVDQKIDVDTL